MRIRICHLPLLTLAASLLLVVCSAAPPADPPAVSAAAQTQALPPSDAETDPWQGKEWNRAALATGDTAAYLDAAARDVVYHLNLARDNPAKYAAVFITPMKQFYRDKLYREPGTPDDIAGVETEEGLPAVDECIKALKAAARAAPLKPAAGLSQAAADHAADQARTGGLGHTGADGSNPAARARRHGHWMFRLGENISYGPATARRIVGSLLVDDGVAGRGHRDNILKPDFKVVGVALAKHPKYGCVCVIDFAGGYTDGAGK